MGPILVPFPMWPIPLLYYHPAYRGLYRASKIYSECCFELRRQVD